MHLNCKYLMLGALWMGIAMLTYAQKTDGSEVQNPAPETPAASINSNRAATPLTYAQLKRSLKATSKRLQKQLKKADWADDSCVVRISQELGIFAADIFTARESHDPAAQGLASQYLPKYKSHLATYQNGAPLDKQAMAPPIAPGPQILAHEAFAQIVRSYAFLIRLDQQPKPSWAEQEFVDHLKTEINLLDQAAIEYQALDPANYGRVERYTATAATADALWAERMELPAQLEAAQKILTTHTEPFRVLSQAGPMFEDHAAFLRANQAFQWDEIRRQIVLMNAWEVRPRGDETGAASEMQRWVGNWPADMQIFIDKQIAVAKANIGSADQPFLQWQAAERILALLESAVLIYPSKTNYADSIGNARTIASAKKKVYEASLSSDYHRQNVGGVGLSTTGAIGFRPLSSFKAGEKVILTLFLDRPAEIMSPGGKFELKMEGIADQPDYIGFGVAPSDKGKSYIDITLLGNGPYGLDTRMAEEAILGALCLAEGRTLKLSFYAKSTNAGRSSFGPPLQVTFDGSDAAGMAIYRARWAELTKER